MSLVTYQKLVEITTSNDIQLEHCEYSALRIKDVHNPISIKEREFRFLYAICEELQLKSGFEVATAFGVSSLAVALSMKHREGKLVTMDSYIEENSEHCLAYGVEKDNVHKDARGFKNVNFFIDHFSLKNVLIPTVGVSIENLQKHNKNLLDYVMIDALHTDAAATADFLAISSQINKEKYLIAVHDPLQMYPTLLASVKETLPDAKFLQSELFFPPNGYELSFITNIDFDVQQIYEKSESL